MNGVMFAEDFAEIEVLSDVAEMHCYNVCT